MQAWRGLIVGITISVGLSLLGLFYISTYSYHTDIRRIDRDMITLEDRMSVKAGNWIHYLETRVNRASASQDEYQTSTSRRIDYLSDRIGKLENEIKQLEKKLEDAYKDVRILEERINSPANTQN